MGRYFQGLSYISIRGDVLVLFACCNLLYPSTIRRDPQIRREKNIFARVPGQGLRIGGKQISVSLRGPGRPVSHGYPLSTPSLEEHTFMYEHLFHVIFGFPLVVLGSHSWLLALGSTPVSWGLGPWGLNPGLLHKNYALPLFEPSPMPPPSLS